MPKSIAVRSSTLRMVATEALLPSMPATIAAAPATCGLAMDVPLCISVPVPIASERMSVPGAARSTKLL